MLLKEIFGTRFVKIKKIIMEKEFVSYELAKLLANIGMNKDRKTSLLAFISKNNTIYTRSASYAPQDSIDTFLYQQVFDWFREEHHIIGAVYSSGSGYEWEYHYNKTRGGTSIKMSCVDGDCELSGAYTTYEKAREDLIKNYDK